MMGTQKSNRAWRIQLPRAAGNQQEEFLWGGTGTIPGHWLETLPTLCSFPHHDTKLTLLSQPLSVQCLRELLAKHVCN